MRRKGTTNSLYLLLAVCVPATLLVALSGSQAQSKDRASSSFSSGETSVSSSQDLEQRYRSCVRKFDDECLAGLIAEITPTLEKHGGDFERYLLVAECYLARCDLRRSKRKTYKLGWSEKRSLRKQQLSLSEKGLIYADKARELNPESSEAFRVTGELYIHHITGPIAGFRYGPRGKTFIEKALELDPENPEAKRAIGLMYLYNPPFNGGDRKKAAETFDEAVELGGDDRCYVLAARAYLKLKDPAKAKERLAKALEINPDNREARALIRRLGR